MNRREALRQFGSGAMLGSLVGAAVTAVSYQTVEAPAAEFDPLLALINEYQTARAAARELPVETSAECEAYDALMKAHVDPLFWRLVEETPQATTAAGALAALALVKEGIDEGECAYDEPLLVAAMRFLDQEAA